uniref:Uncharacterized protein n=1 Tax=Anguilla anguilla TaxID=7936 RepID=A0A0E9US80_ANGAN
MHQSNDITTCTGFFFYRAWTKCRAPLNQF